MEIRLGILPTIFIVLLILKLVGATAISWWWVFSPLLILAGLLVITIFVVLVLDALDY